MPNYIQDPNNPNKQVPGDLPDNYYTRTATPGACSFVKSPNYVIVNTAMDDNFGFFFGSKQKFDGLADSNDSVNYDASFVGLGTVGTKLDIHPTAISCSVRDAGQITFVYKGGLDGSGRP
tara:strand:- start:78 stop:437 length:360 start_codon:yes stop_codon:yes gene_type:complete